MVPNLTPVRLMPTLGRFSLRVMSEADTVVYCTRTNRIIDFVTGYGNAGTALSTLDKDYGPDLVVLPFADANRRYEDGFRAPPVAITIERYWEMLEILPPVGFVNTGMEESFKMSERTAGNITAIFARVGDRYFELADSLFMKHADIIAAVRNSEAFRQADVPNKA